MEVRNSMSVLKYEGYWAIPDAPDIRVVGTLEVIPGESLQLTFFGDFEAPQAHQVGLRRFQLLLDDIEMPNIMHGRALHEEKWLDITLLRLQVKNRSSDEKVSRTVATVHFAVVGQHFSAKGLDDIALDALEVSYSHLPEWLQQTVFSTDRNSRGATPHSRRVTYQHPNLPKFHISALNAGFAFNTTVSQISPVRSWVS